eukprot:g3498.t1
MRHIPIPSWDNPPPTREERMMAEAQKLESKLRLRGSRGGRELFDSAVDSSFAEKTGQLQPLQEPQESRKRRRKKKSKGFKTAENAGDMFTHKTIGDTGDHGGKNEVLSTVKLFMPQHPEESQVKKLDNMIFAGFTDHDLRNKAEAGLEDVAAFLGLPGGGIVPAASDALIALAGPRKEKLMAEQKFKDARNCDFEKLEQDFFRVNTHLKKMESAIRIEEKQFKAEERARQRLIRKDERFLEEKYGVGSPNLNRHRAKVARRRKKSREEKTRRLQALERRDKGEGQDNAPTLGGTKKEKRERIQREREKRERIEKRERKARRRARKLEGQATKSVRAAKKLYGKQSKQIATAIELRKEKDDKYRRNAKLAKASGDSQMTADQVLASLTEKNQSRVGRTMEHYYMYHRDLTDAAVTIQRKYREAARIAFWKRHARESLAARNIQKIARGGLTRVMVARWWSRRNFLVCKMQSIIRGHNVRQKWHEKNKREQEACIFLQRCTRGWMGRKRWALEQMTRAATDIQRVWRGGGRLCGRALADKMWLTGHVIKMQRNIRRFVHGRVGVARMHKEMNDAVTMIQRAFRGWLSEKARHRLLRNRSVLQRVLQVNKLRSEAAYLDEAIMELDRDLERAQLDSRLEAIKKEEAVGRGECHQLEFDFLAFEREKRRLSPRAIAQGFVKNIDENIAKYRELTTKSKLKMLFNVGREVKRLEDLRKKADGMMEKMQWDKSNFERWREEDMAVHWQRVADYRKRNRDKHKKQAISEQKRKWSIRFYTANGKPDRKRRYGRPWDKSVYANPDKMRMTMTGDFWTDFSKYENLVKLQNTFNQYQQYGATLKPLMDTWENFGKNLEVAGTHADVERELREARRLRREHYEQIRQKEIAKEMAEDERERKAAEERQKRREERMLTKSQIAEEAKKLYKPRNRVWDLLESLDEGKEDLKTEMRKEREEEIRNSFKKKSDASVNE